jgi:DNA-binding CsgD family transcriptional regulator
MSTTAYSLRPFAARAPEGALATLERLTLRERRILSEVIEGSSSKSIALTVGLSETQVSKTLANSALKLGLRSRAELVQYAAMLGRPVTRNVPHALTIAERDVLELIVGGYSNLQIATLRGRSQRTIANQVSALLRKTGLTSRRNLMVAFCNAAHLNLAV